MMTRRKHSTTTTTTTTTTRILLITMMIKTLIVAIAHLTLSGSYSSSFIVPNSVSFLPSRLATRTTLETATTTPLRLQQQQRQPKIIINRGSRSLLTTKSSNSEPSDDEKSAKNTKKKKKKNKNKKKVMSKSNDEKTVTAAASGTATSKKAPKSAVGRVVERTVIIKGEKVEPTETKKIEPTERRAAQVEPTMESKKEVQQMQIKKQEVERTELKKEVELTKLKKEVEQPKSKKEVEQPKSKKEVEPTEVKAVKVEQIELKKEVEQTEVKVKKIEQTELKLNADVEQTEIKAAEVKEADLKDGVEQAKIHTKAEVDDDGDDELLLSATKATTRDDNEESPATAEEVTYDRKKAQDALVMVGEEVAVLKSESSSASDRQEITEKSIKKVESEEENIPENKVYDCLIVGGGISGCTLAHNLYYTGTHNILLTEARDYLGGNVKSHTTADGFVWEEGPNSFATQPSIVRIAYELGIDNQLVFADEALPPWVNHNGKLHPLPKGQGGKGPKGQIELVFGPNGVLKFALIGDLLSWPGKIRAGIGAFLGHLAPPELGDETIREWVTRTLGEEVFLRCIDPFVSGVYAGDPQTLSMKAALPKIAAIEAISYSIGWNKGGAIFYGGLKRQVELTKERKADPPAPEWVEFEYGNPGSFRKGLSTLPNAISQELGQPLNDPKPAPNSKVRLSWKLIKLEKKNGNNSEYVATFDTPTGQQTVRSKTVVSTIPAHALKGVFTSVIPEVDKLCTAIRQEINRVGIYYPPVAAVTVAYPKKSFKDIELPNGFGNLQNLPGFGNLNPRSEGVRTLGTLWSSSLFPDRAPADYNLLLNYIGGSRDTSIANMTNAEIINAVDKSCRDVLLQPNAPPPKVLGLKLWPTAIPQYEKGHLPLIQQLVDAERSVPGLWICGNYRNGVAFPDCVTWGYDHSKIVTEHLQKLDSSSSSASSSNTVESEQPTTSTQPAKAVTAAAAEMTTSMYVASAST